MTPTQSRPILLWGGVGSGKSGVLGALYDLAANRPPDHVGWSLAAQDAEPETAQYLVSMRDALLERMPQPTTVKPVYPRLALTVRKRVRGRTLAQLPLSFVDPAGELHDNPKRLKLVEDPLLANMVTAGSVIWLFDATQPPTDRKAMLAQLSELLELSNGKRLDTPVAICLSKVDRLGETRMREVLADPAKAVQDHLGEVYRRMLGTFANTSCFAISSAGTVEHEIRPIGLDNVFDWVHQQQRSELRALAWRRNAPKLRRTAMFATLVVLVLLGGRAIAQGERMQRRRERENHRQAVLELASDLYRRGQLDSVVSLLAFDELPISHPRAIEWDTLLAFAAHKVAVPLALAGNDTDNIVNLAKTRVDRALEQLKDSGISARLRYVRAESCMVTECSADRIREDLEFVQENSTDRRLRKLAAEKLQALRRSR